jgi:hypothetical protein
MAEPLTKAQIIERDEPLLTAHPMREWLHHGDHCPSRRMRIDMLAVDGPCSCGLTAYLIAERATGNPEGIEDVTPRPRPGDVWEPPVARQPKGER